MKHSPPKNWMCWSNRSMCSNKNTVRCMAWPIGSGSVDIHSTRKKNGWREKRKPKSESSNVMFDHFILMDLNRMHSNSCEQIQCAQWRATNGCRLANHHRIIAQMTDWIVVPIISILIKNSHQFHKRKHKKKIKIKVIKSVYWHPQRPLIDHPCAGKKAQL